MGVYEDAYTQIILNKLDKSNPYHPETKEWAEWEEGIEDAILDKEQENEGNKT